MRTFQIAVDKDDGSVLVTVSTEYMHTCVEFDAEEYAMFVTQVNGAFGDSKMAAS